MLGEASPLCILRTELREINRRAMRLLIGATKLLSDHSCSFCLSGSG